MRRAAALTLLAVLAGIAAGCGGGGSGSSTSTGSKTTSASSCTKKQLKLVTANTLTIGTGNPAYAPWYEGGRRRARSSRSTTRRPARDTRAPSPTPWPSELGFTKNQVKWVPVAFNLTFKPGAKDFDFAMQQISYNPQRAKAVTFSKPYFNNEQSLVALKDKPIAKATSFSDLKDAKLGVVVGTTSYDYINDNIKPTNKPLVYDTLDANVAALKVGQIDGLVTDFPTAYYIANVQLSNATLVGRLPTIGKQEYFGVTFEKGNPLAPCVNKAIEALKQDGKIEKLEQQWITSKAHAPQIHQ